MTRADADTRQDEAVVVALGSNLGDSRATLERALEQLTEAGLIVLKRSRWWRSRAWPDPEQPPFLNGVAIVDSPLQPARVLAALLAIETALGRVRAVANAPRTLDMDLVAYGRRVQTDAGLMLPHPRAHERRFVMGPLAEIAPDWRHPVSGRTARVLADEAAIGRDATPDV